MLQNGWMSVKVGQARKKYGVKYPAMYADKASNKDADAFNCVQRGHQNTLENFPALLALLLVTGLRVSDDSHCILPLPMLSGCPLGMLCMCLNQPLSANSCRGTKLRRSFDALLLGKGWLLLCNTLG